MSAEGHDHAMDHEHEHHHKQTFITKYIFSTDHKMIAKQYLITGILMGVIGIAISLFLAGNWHGQKSHLRF
jgi:cytochrome c oxidase subunit 1